VIILEFGHENEAVFAHVIFADPGIKINGEYIWDVLLKQRCCPISVQFLATSSFFSRTVHPPADWARETVTLLQLVVLSFTAANLRPTNSPDLNPVDRKVQDCVYQAKVRDVDDLKQRLIDVWDGLEQSVIDDTIDQWRSRLRARVLSMHMGDILNSLVTCI